MKRIDKTALSVFNFPCAILTGILLSLTIFAQQDENKPQSRDIIPVFESARPGAAGAGKPSVGGDTTAPKSPRPTYKRISQKSDSGKISKIDRPAGSRPSRPPAVKPPVPKTSSADIPVAGAKQIGITIWKLFPAKGDLIISEDDEPISQIVGGKNRYLVSRRVSLDTIFETGDYVRLGIESANRGYLYIVDQEMYADGTTGDAYLVFPNKRLRGGANLVTAGSPVEIPDLTNNPFYFELRPQSENGKKIIAEVLSIIITDQLIAGLEIGSRPTLISEQILSGWRTKWSGRAEIFEAEGNSGKGYTKAERQAAGGNQKLTAADSLPQTIFLVEDNRRGGSLVTVPLWYGNE